MMVMKRRKRGACSQIASNYSTWSQMQAGSASISLSKGSFQQLKERARGEKRTYRKHFRNFGRERQSSPFSHVDLVEVDIHVDGEKLGGSSF
jgi:hypothetical protein